MSAPRGRDDQMRRRDLIAGLLLAGATPRAWAQTPERVYRIATVSVAMPLADLTEKTSSSRTIRALFEELRRRGYFEGRNLVVKPYSGDGREEERRNLAGESCDAQQEGGIG